MKQAARVIALFLIPHVCWPATIRVPDDHGTIQEALDAAADGDTVLVASGEYIITAPIDFNRLHDPADPGSPPVKNIALRSEGGADVTTIRMSDDPDELDRASVVIFHSGESADTVLEGFLLTGGRGSTWEDETWRIGAGVLCAGTSSPILKDCTISGNETERGGGVACVAQTSPSIESCKIVGNKSYENGGALYCGRSSPRFLACTISENAASWGGAGYFFEESAAAFSGCTIAGNMANEDGGIGFWASSPSFVNCTIKDNTTFSGAAGAIGCLLDASPSFTNCTISGNSSDLTGGVYCINNSSPILESCIIWDNAGPSIWHDGGSSPQVTFSCVAGASPWPGVGNINSDPLFEAFGAFPEVYVDSSSPGPGDGSPADPYPDLKTPLTSYGLALAGLSPCLGTGKDGTNMGADNGTCPSPGATSRNVHVAPGAYSIAGLNLAHRVSLLGAGEADTTIEKSVLGLRSGALVSDLTITMGETSGLRIAMGEGPTIQRTTITGNSMWTGGGVYCFWDSTPSFINCTISGNTASDGEGGGAYFGPGSSPSLTGCTISDNSATDEGGGAYFDSCSPTLQSCWVLGNQADRYGGGLYFGDSDAIQLDDCTVSGNSAGFGAGGVLIISSTAGVSNSAVSRNWAEYYTGGIGFYGAQATMANCNIADNTAAGNSNGGIFFSDSDVECFHCTISGNAAAWDADGVRIGTGSDVEIKSSILWDNGSSPLMVEPGGTLTVTYSAIESDPVWPGTGNINESPQFCAWGSAGDVYADSSVSPGGDGSPGDPYSSLAQALEFNLGLSSTSPCLGTGEGGSDMGAANGTCASAGVAARTIRLAAGTYDIRNLNLVHHASLEGAGAEETTVEGTILGLLTGAVLSGVKVTRGSLGGVRINWLQSPEIRECVITDNPAGNAWGGGVWVHAGSPTFTDCTISENSAARGGAMYLHFGSPTLTRCRIVGNQATEDGGGVYTNGSTATFTDSTIASNWSLLAGGGIRSINGSNVEFTGSTIAGNLAFDGGGLASEDSTTLFTGCTFSGNAAADLGGAGRCVTSDDTFTNCTVAGNAAGWKGGALSSLTASPSLKNCIVWQNGGKPLDFSTDSTPSVTYSCVEGPALWPGAGNINDDPLFGAWGEASEVYVDAVSAPGGDGTYESPYSSLALAFEYDLALADGSPCRGAGEGGADMGADSGACDAAGETRRTVRLASGTYTIRGLSFSHGLSLEGASRDSTVLEGTVLGLTTGAGLSRVQVTKGAYGGIRVGSGESPEILECDISRNSIHGLGGGVWASENAPILRGCRIWGNSAEWGGGIYCHAAAATINRCTIAGNSAAQSGGGIYGLFGADFAVESCEIFGNSAEIGGGVSTGGAPRLVNSTVAWNSGRYWGGGIDCYGDAAPVLTNCIIWGNEGGSLEVEAGSNPSVDHSCVEDGLVWPGEGNTNGDPLFFDEGEFDFSRLVGVDLGMETVALPDFITRLPNLRLRPGSPSIDSGTDAGAPSLDVAGNTRPCGAATDQGAHESCPPASVALRVDQGETPDCVTLDWAGYDEVGPHGIGGYRIYASPEPFDDILGLDFQAEAPAGTFTASLCGLTVGETYWFSVVALDGTGDYFPGVAPATWTPGGIALEPGVPVTVTLTQGSPRQLFNVSRRAADALILTLSDPDPEDANALYVKWGSLPGPVAFDLAAAARFRASQRLVVPWTRDIPLYILARANIVSGGSNEVTVEAKAAEIALESLSASRVGQGPGAEVSAAVVGAGLDEGTRFVLEKPGGGPSFEATQVTLVSAERAEMTFDLYEAPAGKYDLHARDNSGTFEAEPLGEAFEVTSTSIGPYLEVSIRAPEFYRPERVALLNISYKNVGDREMSAPLFRVRASHDSTDPSKTTRLRLETEEGARGFELQALGVHRGGVAGRLPPGAGGEVPVVFTSTYSEGERSLELAVEVLTPSRGRLVEWDALDVPDGMTDSDWKFVWPPLSADMGANWNDYLTSLGSLATRLARRGVGASSVRGLFRHGVRKAWGRPGSGAIGRLRSRETGAPLAGKAVLALQDGVVRSKAVTDREGSFALDWLKAGETYDVRVAGYDVGARSILVPAEGDLLALEIEGTESPGPTPPEALDRDETGLPESPVVPPPGVFTTRTDWMFTVKVVNSWDPNEKDGKKGVVRDGVNLIRPGDSLTYTIHFRNEGRAAVQKLVVTDLLDEDLDWGTFEPLDVQIGALETQRLNFTVRGSEQFSDYSRSPSSEGYTTKGVASLEMLEEGRGADATETLDVEVLQEIDITTGLARWEFEVRGAGVLEGFLPPSPPEESERPESQGHVSFRVKPKKDLPEGTDIVNPAGSRPGTPPSGVKFDTNAVEPVTPWANKISLFLGPEGPPRNPVPGDGHEDVDPEVVLGWSEVQMADAYDLYLWKDGAEEPSEGEPSATVTLPFHSPASSLEKGTAYRWYVVARNENGSERGGPWTFRTWSDVAPPEEPAEPEVTMVDGRFVLDWADASGARGYSVWVWPRGEDRPEEPSAAGIRESRWAVPRDLPAGTEWEWQVAALNSSDDTLGDVWSVAPGRPFLRGDPNNDGSTNITDGIYVLNFLFLGGPAPTCMESADPNDDGTVNITDGIYILNYLFLGGTAPVAPGPAGKGLPCGWDRAGSPKDLGCTSYTACGTP